MNKSFPLLLAEEMRAAEASWFAAGNDSFALMLRAAREVADVAETMIPTQSRVLVVCGPGNNGGDGFVVARLLADQGHDVQVLATGGTRQNDAARAEAMWNGPISHQPAEHDVRYDLVVDALFGIGLSRAPTGEAEELIRHINRLSCPVLAVDMPSGVDSDTGAAPGVAVKATVTVSFHTAKPGHLLLPGRSGTGRLYVADIGLPETKARQWRNGSGLWTWPKPATDTHKYARGGVVIWCGPALMTGAARMAAYAAMRAGAGASLLLGDMDAIEVAATQVTAPLLAVGGAAEFAGLLQDHKWQAGCIGPGGGQRTREIAEAALRAGKPLVLDADALTAFAGVSEDLATLVQGNERDVILTPHEGEFTRLFPEYKGSRIERACKAAAQIGAVIVLKGTDTVIAAPDGRIAINDNAPPWLATAGAGDVLAGYGAALLAQGLPGFEAAAAAVFLHGAVASKLGPGLIAEDMTGPAMMPALAELVENI